MIRQFRQFQRDNKVETDRDREGGGIDKSRQSSREKKRETDRKIMQ